MARGRNRRDRRMDRKHFGSFNQRLTVPDEVKKWAKANNKTLRFVNDQKARIQLLIKQDWDFVKAMGGEVGECSSPQEMGDCYSVVVGTEDNGKPIRAYLMAKEKDWYEEDRKLKSQELDQIDEEIRRGSLGKVESAYQPKDGSGRTVTKYKP